MKPTILDNLLAITELFERDMARAFEGTGLTRARAAVLWALQARGPSTQQTLAEALGVSARNVSALVDALEAGGYVARAPHPRDRRAVLVDLTPTAKEVMASMRREHAAVNQALLAAVAPADLPALERAIDAITTRLSELVEAAEEDERPATGATR